jgi:AcrR family transcriptional regulator
MANQKRVYVLRKRALAVDETRRRIIEAACELLSQAGYPDVSLDQIADRAGISRQTIYVQFGSKRGVLQAVAEHIERASYGKGMVEGARDSTDAAHDLRYAPHYQMEFFSLNAPLLRTFYAQAASDPDFQAVWEDRLNERRRAIHILVEMLARAGRLSEAWSVDDATDWIWSLTDFQRYNELALQRGWPPEKLALKLQESIEALLLLDDGDKNRGHRQASQ